MSLCVGGSFLLLAELSYDQFLLTILDLESLVQFSLPLTRPLPTGLSAEASFYWNIFIFRRVSFPMSI